MMIEGVPVWGTCEVIVRGPRQGPARIVGRFIAPSGRTLWRPAFRDRDGWRLRLMPDEIGDWRYEATAYDWRSGVLLQEATQRGAFRCQAAPGLNRLERHGAVRLAPGGRHLAHADGTPFFFLADTAWSGALLSSESDWQAYLADRKAKGFTAVQFIIVAPWAGAYTDADGRTAMESDEPYGDWKLNLDFFRRMDARIEAIGAAGLLAVPVLAWAAKFGESAKHNPGVSLPTAALERLVQYQVERFGAYHLLWLLAGDGRYGGLRSWKWKRIGRKMFGDPAVARAPVGMHPMGKTWPYGSFRREKWLDLLGYQSSHADDPDTLRWLLRGPPAEAWREDPRPIINLEPCYEGIRNWATTGKAITNVEVRRAMYGSLLNAPTAGVAYGAHGVWSWETEAREPLNHVGSGVAKPWHEAAQFPGSFDVQRLASLFTSIDWWRLRPAPELLRVQPGDKEMSRFISAAATETRDLAVFYLPIGGEISLHSTGLSSSDGFWFDPRTGSRQTASIGADGVAAAPDSNDWVLVLR